MKKNSFKEYKSPEKTIQSLIKQHASMNPSTVALIDGDLSLTYKELDDLTDIIAQNLLKQFEINNQTIIGVYINKSYNYIIACLSVLKTGAKYLHLDEDYSQETLNYILNETSPLLIFSCDKLISNLIDENCIKINLNRQNNWETNLDLKLNILSNNNNTAIIGYTSGTTSTPKGVEVSHRACIYSFNKFWEEIKENENTNRFGYITYLAWDAFSPLTHGATGIIVPNEANVDMKVLKESLIELEINNVFFTPSLLDKFLNGHLKEEIAEIIKRISVIWIGGEIVKANTIQKLFNAKKNIRLINNYGPTECFVVSQGDLTLKNIENEKIINTGYILPEIEYRLYNDKNIDVTENGIGYLFVSGPALANNYFKNTNLTNEKFITIDDRIFYNTGDFCQVNNERRITILGRNSFLFESNDAIFIPVSIIENEILQIKDVKNCVIINSESDGKQKLNVYIVNIINESTIQINEILKTYTHNFEVFNLMEIPIKAASQKIDYSALLNFSNNLN